MAEGRMAVLETVRKAIADGDVDFLSAIRPPFCGLARDRTRHHHQRTVAPLSCGALGG